MVPTALFPPVTVIAPEFEMPPASVLLLSAMPAALLPLLTVSVPELETPPDTLLGRLPAPYRC